MVFFRADNITRVYGLEQNRITVLREINLEIEPGKMTAIVGASGSGKTTLLQILGTLDRPTGGEIIYKDDNLLRKTPKELARFRNSSLGFIFQFHHLLPDFTALENVMIPALIAGKRKKDILGAAEKLLDQVELADRYNHKVDELSGGEQQRAALARALIMEPEILLADEPTGNLDSRSGNLVFELIHSLCREKQLAAIMVTHNTELAERMDCCHTLKDGVLYRHDR
jgi:lipoprotein-releasing system ATP-binding protein